MAKLLRSASFKRQALAFTKDYQQRVSDEVAIRFIEDLERAIGFISNNPNACRIYTVVGEYTFRKWSFRHFPHAIYFRLEQDCIILECLYAHRMDAKARLPDDINHL